MAAQIVDFPPSSDDNDSEQNPERLTAAEEKKDRRKAVKIAWEKLVRWSRSWRSKSRPDVLQRTQKFTAAFLESIVDHVDPGLPFISLSKGLELNTLRMMSQIIPQALRNPRQPFVALSGPSFAMELMSKLPTAMVVASKDKKLANEVQQLLASERLRINTSSDVIGVEIAGALKNVLAIAAGIVEGMNLGNNSMAALVAQDGCQVCNTYGAIRNGDIMLTCFVSLSRNRTVGVRLGSGERLEDILSSMNQVAEGVATAGAVITLAEKYNVKMPVLTAVARIIDNELTPQAAVLELMSLPQVEEV
ncbi:Glycerol-3-phosphate dehydrogenase [NAD(+)] 2 chloroplastic [Bienertia sinuspersici]